MLSLKKVRCLLDISLSWATQISICSQFSRDGYGKEAFFLFASLFAAVFSWYQAAEGLVIPKECRRQTLTIIGLICLGANSLQIYPSLVIPIFIHNLGSLSFHMLGFPASVFTANLDMLFQFGPVCHKIVLEHRFLL